MAIEIKKLSKNSYGGICGKYKFKIAYNPYKMLDQVVWQDFGIENSRTSTDELILEEYKKFRNNEK